ncbi:MAG: HDOD domain-containing protein [Pirellulaceae bacterium]
MRIAPSSLQAKRRFKIAERARWQFTLPPLSAWLLRGGDFDPNDAALLSQQIGANSKLRSTIMRWFNSPVYNWSRPFESVHQAGMVIDPQHQVRIAFLADIGGLVDGHARVGSYNRRDHWRHCIGVGAAASLLSRMTGKGNFLDALIAGTLHDFGIMIAELLVPTRFRRWIEEIDLGIPPDACAEATIEAKPGELAAIVLAQWGLGEKVLLPVRNHQNISEIEAPPHILETICCVRAAKAICCRLHCQSSILQSIDDCDGEVLEHLALRRGGMRMAEIGVASLIQACAKIC